MAAGAAAIATVAGIAAAIVLAGDDQRHTVTTLPAVTTAAQPASTEPQTARSRPAPTRPTGGPLIFRTTDVPTSTPELDLPRIRYLVVFRLSRDPKQNINSDGEAALDVAYTTWGNYSVLDRPLLVAEQGPTSFGTVGTNCFTFRSILPIEHEVVRALNRIPLGGRVKITLRPLTRRSTALQRSARPTSSGRACVPAATPSIARIC